MRFRSASFVCLAALTACKADLAQLTEKIATPEERRLGVRFAELLQSASPDSALAMLAPELRTDTSLRVVQAVAALLRTTSPSAAHVVSANVLEWVGSSRRRHVSLSYESPTHDGKAWVVFSVTLRETGDTVSVVGFSASGRPRSFESENAFTLAHRSPRHFLCLGLAILIPIFTIVFAAYLVRARMPKRWLWALAALVTGPTFVLNWTTGQAAMLSFNWILFGGSATRTAIAAPWLVSFGIPTGALVAYIRYRAWRHGSRPRAPEDGVTA
jgi:hypothetical protein